MKIDYTLLLNRRWRMENLYWIVDELGQKSRLKFRPAQEEFFSCYALYNLILKARQLGFTTWIDVFGLDCILFTPNWRFVIIAETKEKAADIFNNKIMYPYDNLPQEIKDYCKIVYFSSAGKVKFSNGSSIEVMTSARSGTCQILHISELGPICAKSPKKAKEIKTGSLPAVHAGSFCFVESTAMGSEGLFYELSMLAEKDKKLGKKLGPQEFKFHFFAWWENPDYVANPDTIVICDRLLQYFDMLFSRHDIALTEEQQAWYALMERKLGDDMKREYPSFPAEAFQSSNDGAYYSREFDKIYREERITLVPYEESLPVFTFWDLGYSDATSIWFVQFFGREIRVIDYFESSGEGLGFYAAELGKRGYRYGGHFGPHDIDVHELGTGLSRIETAAKLGIKFERVPTNLDLNAGIQAVRELLPYCYFSEEKCAEGIKCLEGYRKEWNEKGYFLDRPRHDATSHGADGFRTLAVAYKRNMIANVNNNSSTGGALRVISAHKKI